jgi:DNA-binding GntR family transcriptional regulator
MINLGAQHENLDQKVYSILKDMIMERQLLPGQKIPQEKLARDLGISRTPLIGALKFLEQDKQDYQDKIHLRWNRKFRDYNFN